MEFPPQEPRDRAATTLGPRRDAETARSPGTPPAATLALKLLLLPPGPPPSAERPSHAQRTVPHALL